MAEEDLLRPKRPPITADELKLLATPDEELVRDLEVFSFDVVAFEKRLADAERWQQLIHVHLYMDHVLTKFLIEALVKPEAINASRLGFIQKLDLVSALDLIPDDLLGSIKAVNQLRNKIVHQLDFVVSDKDEADLMNCTPSYLKDGIRSKSKDGAMLRLNDIFACIVLMMDICRQKNALGRVRERKGAIRLRTVLEKTPGAIYKK